MKKYVDEREVKNLTGFELQTLRNWRCQGRGFPYVKVGRSIRYNEEDVIAYMQNRRIDPENRAS